MTRLSNMTRLFLAMVLSVTVFIPTLNPNDVLFGCFALQVRKKSSQSGKDDEKPKEEEYEADGENGAAETTADTGEDSTKEENPTGEDAGKAEETPSTGQETPMADPSTEEKADPSEEEKAAEETTPSTLGNATLGNTMGNTVLISGITGFFGLNAAVIGLLYMPWNIAAKAEAILHFVSPREEDTRNTAETLTAKWYREDQELSDIWKELQGKLGPARKCLETPDSAHEFPLLTRVWLFWFRSSESRQKIEAVLRCAEVLEDVFKSMDSNARSKHNKNSLFFKRDSLDVPKNYKLEIDTGEHHGNHCMNWDEKTSCYMGDHVRDWLKGMKLLWVHDKDYWLVEYGEMAYIVTSLFVVSVVLIVFAVAFAIYRCRYEHCRGCCGTRKLLNDGETEQESAEEMEAF